MSFFKKPRPWDEDPKYSPGELALPDPSVFAAAQHSILGKTLADIRREYESQPNKGIDMDLESGGDRIAMIEMRLRMPFGASGFSHISTAMTEEKVLVFAVVRDQYTVLEDEIGLFPSDALITQLRLISA
jgi:hypothetical protein